jgi:hypothetical protein
MGRLTLEIRSSLIVARLGLACPAAGAIREKATLHDGIEQGGRPAGMWKWWISGGITMAFKLHQKGSGETILRDEIAPGRGL